MRSRAWFRRLLAVAVLPLLACGAAATAAPTAAAPPPTSSAAVPATAVTDPLPSALPVLPPPPTLAPAPSPTPPPEYQLVGFTGLASGSYPAHVHAICNGRQRYHIAYLPDLSVAAGSGALEVPTAYFGKGWCVIVYANRAATAVAAYRSI